MLAAVMPKDSAGTKGASHPVPTSDLVQSRELRLDSRPARRGAPHHRLREQGREGGLCARTARPGALAHDDRMRMGGLLVTCSVCRHDLVAGGTLVNETKAKCLRGIHLRTVRQSNTNDADSTHRPNPPFRRGQYPGPVKDRLSGRGDPRKGRRASSPSRHPRRRRTSDRDNRRAH